MERLIATIILHLTEERLTGQPPFPEHVVAAVDILALWSQHCGSPPDLTKDIVRRWRAICIQQFDSDPYWDNCVTSSGTDARPERRKVIEATFDRLETVAWDKEL